jgi:hypothetical protein
VGDLLARHATLQATSTDLREALARTAEASEATKADLQVQARHLGGQRAAAPARCHCRCRRQQRLCVQHSVLGRCWRPLRALKRKSIKAAHTQAQPEPLAGPHCATRP